MKNNIIYSMENLIVTTCKIQRTDLVYYGPIKSVLELDKYVFVHYKDHVIFRDKTKRRNTYYNHVTKFHVAIHDSCLFELRYLRSDVLRHRKTYHVTNMETGKYVYRDDYHDCETIVDFIKRHTHTGKIDPNTIIYPKVLYDHLWPTYRINRNAYCDTLILCLE